MIINLVIVRNLAFPYYGEHVDQKLYKKYEGGDTFENLSYFSSVVKNVSKLLE